MWDEFKAWAKQPFSSQMDLVHWFYFLGLMIILLAAWGIVFGHLRGAVNAASRT